MHAENEQKTQAGMAAFPKPPKPHDLQSALPEMHLRLQAEFPGRRDRLPALSIQTDKEERPRPFISWIKGFAYRERSYMNKGKIANTSTENSTALQTAQIDERPTLVKKIGKTTYRVTIHFSATSRETMSDKIKRMLRNEVSRM